MNFLIALICIVLANSAPILIRQLPVLKRFDYPLDFHKRFIDGRRWLGQSKTWRGVIASVILTTICAYLLNIGWKVGAIVAVLAMAGDSLSSFIKRRAGYPPSAMVFGLDQVPESLLPILYLQYIWQLAWWQAVLLVICFVLLELSLSRVFYYMHVRKHPY